MQIILLLALTILTTLQVCANEFSLIQPMSVEKAPQNIAKSPEKKTQKSFTKLEDLKVNKSKNRMPTENLTKMKFLDINFKSDQFIIPDEDIDKLKDFAKYLKENKGYQAIIYSHTDSTGGERKNRLLSQNRANSIKKGLEKSGVRSTRLTAIGKGELEPLESNNFENGRNKNNRIEVLIIK